MQFSLIPTISSHKNAPKHQLFLEKLPHFKPQQSQKDPRNPGGTAHWSGALWANREEGLPCWSFYLFSHLSFLTMFLSVSPRCCLFFCRVIVLTSVSLKPQCHAVLLPPLSWRCGASLVASESVVLSWQLLPSKIRPQTFRVFRLRKGKAVAFWWYVC